jgi:hypothetical protein
MQDRLAWLKLNPSLWRGYDGGPGERAHKYKIVEAMRAAGLYSETTNLCDIQVIGLIKRIRADQADRRSLKLPP